MTPRSRPRPARLAAILLVVVVATGLATSAASADSLPSCQVTDLTTAQLSYGDWSRTVLDTTYRLSSGYGPSDRRSTSAAGLNGGHTVRTFVVADLKAMARAARAAGARLAVQSAYRSYTTQKSTFAYWVRRSGYKAALRTSARPGHSEHQLGTTLDFRSFGGSAPWNYRDWGTTKAGKWLKANAWKYGFVMSYPKGKSGVTCYSYEPWHFRYVGRLTAADVRASGLTLREYLWRDQAVRLSPPIETPTPTEVVEPTPGEPTPPAEPTPGEPTPVAELTPTEPTPAI